MKFEKKNKPVTKNIWKFMGFLPRSMRKKIIRSKFEVNYDLSSDYVFKHAETAEEIQDALHIVYENYAHLGYIDKRAEQLHFNTYLCLPTTTILIVKHKGEVIGTMSIVPDSPFGLPTETTWDLSRLRMKYKYMAEISALSIKKSHKSSKGHILLTLCKLMWEYCVKVLKIECIVMAGTQEVEAFYTDLLCFEKVTAQTGQEHKLVKGNKSTCCYLDLIRSDETFEKEYIGSKPRHNFHNFIMHYSSPLVFLPGEHISLHGLHRKKNQAMIQILEKFPNLKTMFSDLDKMKLSNLDPHAKFDEVMEYDNLTTRVFPRVSIRSTDAFIYEAKTSRLMEIKLMDVSNQGFGIKLSHTLNAKKNDKFVLIFQIDGQTMSIHSEIQWGRTFEAGFIVQEHSRMEWLKFVKLAFNEISLPIEAQRTLIVRKAA